MGWAYRSTQFASYQASYWEIVNGPDKNTYILQMHVWLAGSPAYTASHGPSASCAYLSQCSHHIKLQYCISRSTGLSQLPVQYLQSRVSKQRPLACLQWYVLCSLNVWQLSALAQPSFTAPHPAGNPNRFDRSCVTGSLHSQRIHG